MKTMEITIKKPALYTAADWPTVSERILLTLNNRFGIVPTAENCGTQLMDFLDDQALRYITLQVFGTTAPAAILKTSELMITGDGRCPSCGSDNMTEIIGSFKYCEEHGVLGSRTIGWQCMQCGEEVQK